MSTRKAIPGLLLAAALSVSPALAEGPSTGAGSVQVIDRVVARVGPEAITHREVQTVLSQTPGGTYNQALEALIDRTLVLVWARDKNIVVAPGDVDRVQETIMLQNNMDEEQFRQALSERGQSLESFRQSLRDQITISRAVEMALGAHVKV
ncbi:MAG: SurA N-terminal domain-containing protein, partial [bacterium]